MLDAIEKPQAGERLVVGFPFPLADGPLIEIRPGSAPSLNITLQLPPTRSVLLRINPESVVRDKWVFRYSDPSREALYRPSLQAQGANRMASHRYFPIETEEQRASRNDPYTWLFPFVGLNLSLGVALEPNREPKVLHGPVRTGDQVELVIEADQHGPSAR